MAAALVDRTVLPWVPPVSFAERPEHKVKPTAEDLKARGLNRPDIRRPVATDFPCEVRHESRLLTLPLELRLSIYLWVYLMKPVHHAQLAPWYPVPYQKQYISKVVTRAETQRHNDDKNGTASGAESGMLPSDKPLCGMPTSLLRTNREIYHEARAIPFIYNEFVFVNWFSSGIWAARSFTRLLRPWQLSSIRQLRLELLSRDLMGSGSRELSHVCTSLASGIRYLRLKIAPGGSSLGLPWLKEKAESWMGDVSEGRIGWGWAEEGLAMMTLLERVEIELVIPSWGDTEKIRWCQSLEEVLRGKGLAAVEVVCVEQRMEKKTMDADALLEEMAMSRQ